MLSLVGIKINLFPPEPSFLFQAEILGHKLSILGRLAKEVYMKYVCVCMYVYVSHTHTHTVKVGSLSPAATGELKQ